ncbi:MAG: hypothetical protein KME45_28480 [Stenomitos rutilans HA7619-LM2]|nr:hypothetical protein [Stenomitos rutilans HA7619-LM2]
MVSSSLRSPSQKPLDLLQLEPVELQRGEPSGTIKTEQMQPRRPDDAYYNSSNFD